MGSQATEAERVAECLAWARSRIAHCRRQEAEAAIPLHELTEARTERRALLAVVEILTGEEVPRG